MAEESEEEVGESGDDAEEVSFWRALGELVVVDEREAGAESASEDEVDEVEGEGEPPKTVGIGGGKFGAGCLFFKTTLDEEVAGEGVESGMIVKLSG